ncbi:hypothetical protein GINT2_000833 [Glugoides intestinalis]
MFSYKERLMTFADWPAEFKTITKRLAIMGQYSVDPTIFSTCCLYCKKNYSNWDIKHTPLLEHYKKNKGCALFKLAYYKARKELSTALSRDNCILAEEYLTRKFIQLNIAEKDMFFCMRCGSNDLKHMCDGTVQRFTENIEMKTSQFYIRYLNGDYIEQADMCIEKNSFYFKNDQKVLARYLLETVRVDSGVTETFGVYLDRCADKLFQELEKKMKIVEKDAIENIYNESMMLL